MPTEPHDAIRFLKALFAPEDLILIRPIETYIEAGKKCSKVDYPGVRYERFGGQVCVSADLEPNTWLPEKRPRNFISLTNGILDVDAVLADKDDYMRPNSPQWWSMVSLPYEFNPDATCLELIASANAALRREE